MLVDVHAHIDFPQFDQDRDAIIKKAEKEEILIVNSGMGSEGMERTLELTKRYENIFATLGINPREFNEKEIENCINLIRKNKEKIIGIGEVGLDYYWIKESEKRELEMENFQRFIELSNELNLPLIVHSRDSEANVIKILRDFDSKAILHCFGGSMKEAEEAILLGNLISIPTSVVYSKQKQEMVGEIPLEHLVLETDAPYLAPVPRSRNEPINLKLSVQKIANMKDIDKEIVENTTTENAKRFFNLK